MLNEIFERKLVIKTHPNNLIPIVIFLSRKPPTPCLNYPHLDTTSILPVTLSKARVTL